MRTICALLDLNNFKYDQKEINIFHDQNPFTQKDQGFNPLGYQSPTLVHSNQTIIGDSSSIYKYLCLSQGITIDESHYPRQRKNSERKKVIDNYMEYIESIFAKNSSKITKLVIQNLNFLSDQKVNDQTNKN